MKLRGMRYGECEVCGEKYVYVYSHIGICNTCTKQITTVE